jgi:hypothetical protein
MKFRLFNSGKEKVLYFIIVALITLAAVAVTVMLKLPAVLKQEQRLKEYLEDMQAEDPYSGTRPQLGDYLVDADINSMLEPRWFPFREKKEKWTSQETQPYWQDPYVIVSDLVEVGCEKELALIFEKVQ